MRKTKIIPLNFTGKSKRITHPYECEVHRSRRKTLAIHVSHRKVEVRCPMRASHLQIRTFIDTNRSWIEKRLLEESKRNRELLRIEKGRKILYKARELTIIFEECPKERIVITRDRFIIRGPKLNARKAREQVEAYLIRRAENHLPWRAQGLADYLKVGRKLKTIKLRKTKTKWGHCTSTGIIQFNWLIMLAPNAIIDYMIAHEVCHLIHMNHSPRYWALVQSLCPDYEYYREWLKLHEHRFWL
ncbi:MAG: SprT family zinc-dependent metalloprotease [Pseudohongiellaceae bacterium]